MRQITMDGSDALPLVVDGHCLRCAIPLVDTTTCAACIDAETQRHVAGLPVAASTVVQYAIVWRNYARFAYSVGEYARHLDGDTIARWLVMRVATGTSARTAAHDWAILRAIAGHWCMQIVVTPPLRAALSDLRRDRNAAPLRHARALLPDDLLTIVRRDYRYSRLQYHRDTSLILLGWAIGARPQDLARLRWNNVTFYETTATVSVSAGKTAARNCAIVPAKTPERCPLAWLRRWAECMGVDETNPPDWPIFCRIDRWGNYHRQTGITAEGIADIVTSVATHAGLGPGYGGNSMRAGFVTSAAAAGVDDRDIARVTGHKTLSALSRYRREIAALSNPALKLL